MPKKPVLILVVLAFTSVFAVSILGQTSRKSVTAAEVTGTFRHSFSGKFGGTSEAIRILSIGKGKLKVAFDLVYPYYNGREVMANTGQADGTAEIKGDTAVYF
jgi:hypothetical protein